MKKRRVPLRMCIGCKDMKPKQELVRVVKGPEGDIGIDLNGRTPGRGAYICHDLKCFEKIKKHNLLANALKQKIDEEIYSKLKDVLTEGDTDK